MRALSILLSLFTLALLASCSVQDPEFRSIDNIEVLDANKKTIKVQAEALLYNPNSFSITIQEAQVDVKVNGLDIGKVERDTEQEVSGKSEFSIPFIIQVPVSAISDNPLAGLFNLAMGQPIKVEYTGFVKAKALGITKKVDLDDAKEISLKDLKL